MFGSDRHAIGFWIGFSGIGIGTGIDGSVGDPSFEVVDLFLGKFAIGGHLQVRVPIVDGPNQQTLIDGTGYECRPHRSTLTHGRWAIEAKLASQIRRLGTVAFVASLNQNWPDLGFEEIDFRVLSLPDGKTGDHSKQCQPDPAWLDSHVQVVGSTTNRTK